MYILNTIWMERQLSVQVELISDVLLWTPLHGRSKAGWSARTYIEHFCAYTGYNPEGLPGAMNDREKWRERVRDIRADGLTWYIYIYVERHRDIERNENLCQTICSSIPEQSTTNGKFLYTCMHTYIHTYLWIYTHMYLYEKNYK